MPGPLPPPGSVEWSGARWLRGLRTNASPQQASVLTTGLVQSHQVVQDRRYASSRETDPAAAFATALGSSAAGTRNLIAAASRSPQYGIALRYLGTSANVVTFSRTTAIPAGLFDAHLEFPVNTVLLEDEDPNGIIRAEFGAVVAPANPVLFGGGLLTFGLPEQDMPYLILRAPGETIIVAVSTDTTALTLRWCVQAIRWR